MVPEPFSADVTDDGSVVTVTVTGDVDRATCPALTAAFANALSAGRNVVVDLGAVGFLDSSGLNCLLEGRRRATGSGASLAVTSRSTFVESLLRRTGLLELLTHTAPG